MELVSVYPKLGRLSEFENVRIKVVKDYLLIYEILPDEILVLTVWDARQNPDDLERLLKK